MQNNAANSSETSMATQPGGSVTSRAASESRAAMPGGSNGSHHDSATVTGAKFRHGLLQLMIHTIDPMHDGKNQNENKIHVKWAVYQFAIFCSFCFRQSR